MPYDVFVYPPGVCTDIDVYHQQQPLLSLAYATDGLGDPVPDGTAVSVGFAIDKTWDCCHVGFVSPCGPGGGPRIVECCDGPAFIIGYDNRYTRNGYTVIDIWVGPYSGIKELHWEIDGNESEHITFPTYTCVEVNPSGCNDPNGRCVHTPTGNGCDGDSVWIDGMPVLTATPGDGEILWDWSAVASFLPADIGIEYGISVVAAPLNPSASPPDGFIAATSFLSTGLTNGIEYRARVQAYLAVGVGFGGVYGLGSNPGSISNIAAATPAGSEGSSIDLSRVRWRVGD